MVARMTTKEGIWGVGVYSGWLLSVVAYDPSRDHGGKTRGEDLLLVRTRVRNDLEQLRKTLLTIVQTGFERKDDRDGVEGGWPSILEALERVVAERRST
jgi:hypothetical protein